jgi:hypothetical protein
MISYSIVLEARLTLFLTLGLFLFSKLVKESCFTAASQKEVGGRFFS